MLSALRSFCFGLVVLLGFSSVAHALDLQNRRFEHTQRLVIQDDTELPTHLQRELNPKKQLSLMRKNFERSIIDTAHDMTGFDRGNLRLGLYGVAGAVATIWNDELELGIKPFGEELDLKLENFTRGRFDRFAGAMEWKPSALQPETGYTALRIQGGVGRPFKATVRFYIRW